MPEFSITEANTQLMRLIHAAEEGEPVHITRRGRRVAVVLSEVEYARLTGATRKTGLWQSIQDWRAIADFAEPELTRKEIDGWRDRNEGQETI